MPRQALKGRANPLRPPQFVLYNAALRRWPAADYARMEDAGNLYATTIHVLVSAVQKVARAMLLPAGLLLYRGLGGLLDLPPQFFAADERGCKGFVEWGFMSTTAKKQVGPPPRGSRGRGAEGAMARERERKREREMAQRA